MSECKEELTLLLSVLCLKKLRKAAGIQQHQQSSNQLPYNTNKILSESKPHIKISHVRKTVYTFFWLLFSTLMISLNLLIQKYPISKLSLNTFYLINCFSVVLWIFCVKMKSFLCEERVLPQNKRNCFPPNLALYIHNDITKPSQFLSKQIPVNRTTA